MGIELYMNHKNSIKLDGIFVAERTGFEPAIRLTPHTRFPSVRLQPLGHLSKVFSILPDYRGVRLSPLLLGC